MGGSKQIREMDMVLIHWKAQHEDQNRQYIHPLC